MKSIYNSKDNQEVIARIMQLTRNTKAKWGNTTVDYVCKHSLLELDIVFGKQEIEVNKVKKALSTFLKNEYLKCLIYQDRQSFYRRKREKDSDFNELKHELIQKVGRIGSQGKHAIMKLHHPFWGKMTYGKWDRLIYNYLDYHLRQFGV